MLYLYKFNGSGPPKGIAVAQLIDIDVDGTAFTYQEAFDGSCELRLCQPMGRPCFLRKKTARHLVLALRAAFKTANTVRDAEFQRLIVGGFEMQRGDVFDR